MNSVERALRSLSAQTGFEIAEAAAGVARAVDATRRAQVQVEIRTQRCDHLVQELRRTAAQAALDPTRRDFLQRLYRAERQGLDRWLGLHLYAQRVEDEQRDALAQVRYRDCSLQRALKQSRKVQAVEVERRSFVEADALWLHRTMRAGA